MRCAFFLVDVMDLVFYISIGTCDERSALLVPLLFLLFRHAYCTCCSRCVRRIIWTVILGSVHGWRDCPYPNTDVYFVGRDYLAGLLLALDACFWGWVWFCF